MSESNQRDLTQTQTATMTLNQAQLSQNKAEKQMKLRSQLDRALHPIQELKLKIQPIGVFNFPEEFIKGDESSAFRYEYYTEVWG